MNIGNFFKKTLPHLALAVASGIPGPVGAVAQIINTVIPPAPGQPPVPSEPAALNTAVEAATPDQLVSLKQQDEAFAVQMKQLGIQAAEDWLNFAAADTAGARNLQIQTKSYLPAILAGAAVGTLLVCIYLLAFHPLQPTGKDAILLLTGAVVASYKDVYGFFFGSSAGSDAKNQIIAAAVNKQ